MLTPARPPSESAERSASAFDAFTIRPENADRRVEVISDPANLREQAQLRLKLRLYLAAGVLLWIVNPFDREVGVHAPNQPSLILGEGVLLDGGAVLPGFTLPVKDIFPPGVA